MSGTPHCCQPAPPVLLAPLRQFCICLYLTDHMEPPDPTSPPPASWRACNLPCGPASKPSQRGTSLVRRLGQEVGSLWTCCLEVVPLPSQPFSGKGGGRTSLLSGGVIGALLAAPPGHLRWEAPILALGRNRRAGEVGPCEGKVGYLEFVPLQQLFSTFVISRHMQTNF